MKTLLIALALSFSMPAPGEWDGKHKAVEPPMETMVKWEANEVPQHVTVYYNIFGDGKPDIVFAHVIIATNSLVHCDAKEPQDPPKGPRHYITFSTCPAEHAADYFVAPEWDLFKILEPSSKEWVEVDINEGLE